jgi:hypothetical protein
MTNKEKMEGIRNLQFFLALIIFREAVFSVCHRDKPVSQDLRILAPQ